MSILAQLKVLIVDDTSTSRMLIRDGLEQLGIRNIGFAADGEQALKMMMSAPSHLVISDFNMPKLDGLQLLQAIRSYKPTAGVPFIMLTGKGDAAVLTKGKALGLNNYLTKPIDMAALRKAIEGVVGRVEIMGVLAANDHIIQGEYRISNRPECVLTTLLGSCVAACIWDPLLQIGGMNHFLLPGEDDAQIRDSERYGVHLMELLVNGLLREGAARQRLNAKLFGGGNMNSSLADIGARNAEFARNFLHNEGIVLVSESLGGDRARKVQFWPTTGRARQMQLPKDVQPSENRKALAPVFADSGSVELF